MTLEVGRGKRRPAEALEDLCDCVGIASRQISYRWAIPEIKPAGSLAGLEMGG